MPSLPLHCVYATLSCLQHPCQYPLCSLQTCKILHLPWRSRLPCSYLAYRLPTTRPILCHQILPRRHFKSCLRSMLPTPHTSLRPDHISWRQLARLPSLAALPSDILSFTTVLSLKPILPCQHRLLCQPPKPNTWPHALHLGPQPTFACYSLTWHTCN